MCVTLHDASLGQTTIAGWRFAPRRTHCLLYGNEPDNRSAVANAMILHLPVAHGTVLTMDNFIPVQGLRHVLEDMWAAAPKYRELRETRGYSARSVSKGVLVFDMGIYTWVAATQADPEEIRAALEIVRPDRRPQISRQLIEFYLRTWPYDALAIGCFSRSGSRATDPVAIEYVPQEWDILRMPAVDAHGEIPDLDSQVTVNHRLIVGTDELNAGGRVTYREQSWMEPRLREVLPGRVVGAELLRFPMANGDFYVDISRFAKDEDILRARGADLTSRADRIPVLLG